MERDFVGYGSTPPRVEWPGGARVAVSLVVNYEEGSEYSYGFGDSRQEGYKEYPKELPEGVRDFANESSYEYGSRAGFWRIMRILASHGVQATFYCCALALERNAEAARAITAAGHEVCSHGYRWEEPFGLSETEEREAMEKAVASRNAPPASVPVAGTAATPPASTPAACWPPRAGSSMTVTATPTTCPTMFRWRASLSWCCPTPSK